MVEFRAIHGRPLAKEGDKVLGKGTSSSSNSHSSGDGDGGGCSKGERVNRLAGLQLPPEKTLTKNSGRATAKPDDHGDAVLCPARSNPHDEEENVRTIISNSSSSSTQQHPAAPETET
ncbi:hypothetical protein M0804_011086 [Polistes exclamans]|nr:hypothetical protein M0804_011086 [Polistes exclamans]